VDRNNQSVDGWIINQQQTSPSHVERQNMFLPGVSLESGCFAVLISSAFVNPGCKTHSLVFEPYLA
jgi:hypothetical protein